LVIKHIAGTQKCFPIFCEVNNIHILDLVQSATCLKEANAYLESSAREGKSFYLLVQNDKLVL
jgi:ribosomal protein S2